MKKLLIYMALAAGLLSFRYLNADVDSIVAALKSGDAGQVGSFFDDYVDMKLPDKDEVKNIGRNQATLTLKAYFTETGVKGFEKVSEREINGTMYLAGKLQNNSKGQNITILMKMKNGRYQIITLRVS